MSENTEKVHLVIEQIGHNPDGVVELRARAFTVETNDNDNDREQRHVKFPITRDHRVIWKADGGHVDPREPSGEEAVFRPGAHPHVDASVTAELKAVNEDVPLAQSKPFVISGGGFRFREPRSPVPVQLARAPHGSTRDLILWTSIRYSTESIKFSNYSRFLDYVLCGDDTAIPSAGAPLTTDDRGVFTVGQQVVGRQTNARDLLLGEARRLRGSLGRFLSGTEAYRLLREATQLFLRVYCGVLPPAEDFSRIESDLIARVGTDLRSASGAHSVAEAWNAYTVNVNGERLLPYLDIVRQRFADDFGHLPRRDAGREGAIACVGLLEDKLRHPCFIELIWSYWQEEGMLVQTMNAIANRFQNRRGPGERDPLVNLEIDTLRPLNNLLWGYVQNDLERLSVVRRAAEYEHHYGLTLVGRAVSHMRLADRRSKFLEAFHNFLYCCLRFFQQDDDTTVIADGFPVLNAIKEVHYLLAEAASNQFGDLPSKAREEMLVQQWLLSRPEMRDFLGGRRAVPYPELWMDRVDAMKSLQGWTDTSVVHFNDLATFGEQIVLGLRYGGWSLVNEPAAAANFARDWRAEIQGYNGAYRAVTGVDLGAEITSSQAAAERNLSPSAHLRRRLAARRTA